MIARVKRWWRRRNKDAILRKEKLLREFIYLDEVSVTSLLSSHRGAIPSEITETLSRSFTSELSGGGEAKSGVVKANLSSRFESTRTQDYQVLRKATIQATFRDLLRRVRMSLVVTPVSSQDEDLPSKARLLSLIGHSGEPKRPNMWVIPESRLQRGQLAEIDVKLQADPIFQTSTIVSTLADIIGQLDALSSQVDRQQMEQALEVNKLLESLMGGLVPIRCRVVDYEVLALDDRLYMVHREALARLDSVNGASTRPLYLVGVIEQAHFWKDLRRVLFSGARFTVLCRVSSPGVCSSWRPVKLVDVLNRVAPEFGHEISAFGPQALSVMAEGVEPDQISHVLRREALEDYGRALADECTLQPDVRQVSELEELAASNAPNLTSVINIRAAFGEIYDYISRESGHQVESVRLAQMREESLRRSGLLPDGRLAAGSSATPDVEIEDAEGSYLDSEIVAIYW